MKHILITGINSYIGNACESWLSNFPDTYEINKVSVREDTWRLQDWKKYDSVIHVAGIAHNSSDKSLKNLYYQVNRDLAFEIGLKAKNDGVNHFVNMSSIIVFGTQNKQISPDTLPNPDNFYGDSKLQGEAKLNSLADDSFKVAHIRPPMVYGKNSKGNFPLLAKLAIKTPFFPDFDNKRSLIYIKNLTELIRLIVDHGDAGYYHPQNLDYVKTTEIVQNIATVKGHKVLTSKLANPIINIMAKNSTIKKVFGDLYYSEEMFENNLDYQLFDLKESIYDIYK